jgi:glycosyltransferase involved in cell wall biosynthesis
MNLSIIIPVFNEQENISLLKDKISEALDPLELDFEVIWVNDGSTDGSDLILNKIADADKHMKVIHFRKNFGQTAAIMAGIRNSSREIIVPMDADLQNDPADIPRLLEKLDEGYDVCSGWRKQRKDNPVKRTLPSIIANKMISWVSGIKLHDYGCTLKAYRRDVVESIKLYGEMHRFIPIYASWEGAKVTEIPVGHYPRKYGKSKYGINRTFKVILDLLVVKFYGSYFQKPIYIAGGFGIFCFFISLISFLLMLYFKFWGDKSFIQTPLPLFAALFFIVGCLSIFLGLLAEMQMRTYHESQDKTTYLIKEKRNF